MSSTTVPSLAQVEIWFHQSYSSSSAQSGGSSQQQWQASQQISEWVMRAQSSEQYRGPLAMICFQLFADHQRSTEIRFAALSTLSRINLNELERQQLRSFLLFQFHHQFNTASGESPSPQVPVFLRNKAALTLAKHILQDVPQTWSTLVSLDLKVLAQDHPALFLKTVATLLEEFLLAHSNPMDSTNSSANQASAGDLRRVKDYLKGYAAGEDTMEAQQPTATVTTSHVQGGTVNRTPLEELFGTTVHLLAASLHNNTGQNQPKNDTLQVLALETVQAFFMWTELSFLTSEAHAHNTCLECLLACLQPNQTTAVQLAALKAWGEWTTSASTSAAPSTISSLADPRLPTMSAVLLRLHESNILPYYIADGTESEFDIEVVIQVAQLITQFGLELFPLYEASLLPSSESEKGGEDIAALFHKVLDMFFRGLAYDDIDVSGAVLPLASRMAVGMQSRAENEPVARALQHHLAQILNTLYRQLKYPADFSYDWDEDDNAEEEQYRAELCKLFVKLVTASPETCLLFVSEAARQWWNSAATASSPDVEATLRLLYHYAEGIRPTPGVKTVLKVEAFCQVLTAVHSSNVTSHEHVEVLCWYYEMSVRYASYFKQKEDRQLLLGRLLESMSGARGLQHPTQAKVRSRCAYLFLRLVKTLVNLLQPLVESVVQGISNLLSNTELELRPDDTLYLFEAIGLLLGKTVLSPTHQQQYLTMIMTPHVQSIKKILATPGLASDIEAYGQSLSYSIAAIAYLSKGFSSKHDLSEEIQQVLVEATSIALDVLRALALSDAVRNKVMVFLQRMIQSIGSKVLVFMPSFFALLIEHCTSDDILFVAQLFNQLCMKFKSNAIPAIDAALTPFLRKCQTLAQAIVSASTSTSTSTSTSAEASANSASIPPHLYTEQLQIQKLAFTVLHHIVMYNATDLLTNSTNVGHLEAIFITVQDGAITVLDPVIKRTCLKFFRDLLDQWSTENHAYYSGLLTFVCQQLLPGLWRAMMAPSFDERDAQQSRNVTELAHILQGIQQKHGMETVHSALHLSGQWPTSCDPLLETTVVSSNAKALEDCLLQALKFKATPK